MNHGTQPSPAESAAICGTGWPVCRALVGELRLSPGFADAWSPWCDEPPFEPPCEDPPALPPEPVASEPVASEPVDDELELGATGIVDSAVPLGVLDVLGLPLGFPPPTPGRADPYWSCEGELAPAVGAHTAAKSAITATAIANRGM
jgi:hypothetical protein